MDNSFESKITKVEEGFKVRLDVRLAGQLHLRLVSR
jgi:hypothetical protein